MQARIVDRMSWIATAIILPVAVLGTATAAYGLEKTVKQDTEFFVQTAGGQPAICGIEFTIAFEDRLYRQGSIAGVNGSLAWTLFSDPSNIGMILKIRGGDFEPKGLAPFNVIGGFVAVDGQTIMPATTFPCEDTRQFCGLYSLDSSMPVLEALLRPNALTIGFRRKGGRLDTVLPIAVADDSAASHKQKNFMSCILAITDRIKSVR